MKKDYDYLIVGSGLYGVTFASCPQAGQEVLGDRQASSLGGQYLL